MTRRKKSKAIPSTDDALRRTKKKEKKLYDGNIVDGLDPPNHAVPLDELNIKDIDFSFLLSPGLKWPLTRTMMESKTGLRMAGVFVDEHYGEDHWSTWADHPPTWMDPHLFVRLCKSEPRIDKICAIAFRKNDPEAWKRLLPMLTKVFDEQYLPTIIDKFEEDALAIIAQWMLRRFAFRQIDRPEKKKKKKVKKRKST